MTPQALASHTDCPLLPVIGGELRVPLVNGSQTRYINLDYAASAPALTAVAAHITEVLPLYASVHRGAGYASQISTAVYENARVVVGEFVGARPADTVIFTRNTTDSLNLLASVAPGETVVLDLEHHANLLPWIGSTAGARVVRSADTFEATLALLDAELATRPAALLAITGASNVTGEVLPLRRLATLAHRRGTRIAVDGAQLVPHRRVDIAALGIDYLAFSGHKTYAPFGTGVLVGRSDWFDAGAPYLLGGGAVTTVTLGGGRGATQASTASVSLPVATSNTKPRTESVSGMNGLALMRRIDWITSVAGSVKDSAAHGGRRPVSVTIDSVNWSSVNVMGNLGSGGTGNMVP